MGAGTKCGRRSDPKRRSVGGSGHTWSGAAWVERPGGAWEPSGTGRYLAYSPRWGGGEGSGARSRSRRSRHLWPRPARASGRSPTPPRSGPRTWPCSTPGRSCSSRAPATTPATSTPARSRPASGIRRTTRSNPSRHRGTRSAPATRSFLTASCSSPAAPPRIPGRTRTTPTRARRRPTSSTRRPARTRRGRTWRSLAGTRRWWSSGAATSSPSAAWTRPVSAPTPARCSMAAPGHDRRLPRPS